MSWSDPPWSDEELAELDAGIKAGKSWAQIAATLPDRSADGCRDKAAAKGWRSRAGHRTPGVKAADPSEIERAVDMLRRFEPVVYAMETAARPTRPPKPYTWSTRFRVGDLVDVPARDVVEMANRLQHALGGVCGMVHVAATCPVE